MENYVDGARHSREPRPRAGHPQALRPFAQGVALPVLMIPAQAAARG